MEPIHSENISIIENQAIDINEAHEDQVDAELPKDQSLESLESLDSSERAESIEPLEHMETVEHIEPMEHIETTKDEPHIQETFQILPNTLILHEEKPACSEPDNIPDSADSLTDQNDSIADPEKLEASVEECDLVLAQISEASFGAVRTDDEDRFIDAENYVLESGQLTAEEVEKANKLEMERTGVDIQATLFGETSVRGNMNVLFIYIITAIFFSLLSISFQVV